MKRLALWFALAALPYHLLSAQDSTATALARASQAYERLDVERALGLLRQVISPAWTPPVSVQQRVTAHQYLGACLALLGKPDSAVMYFRAAVEDDPFAQLDPNRFTPAQIELFATARRSTFRLAVRPVRAMRIDPRSGHVSFTVVATRPTVFRAELRAAEMLPLKLFADTLEGVREIAWDGLLADGRVAPPGRYEFRVTGSSLQLDRRDSSRVFFDLARETPPLEDTLPPLGSGELLPEQLPSKGPLQDLAKGLAVAATTVFVAGALANEDLGAGLRGGAAIVAVGATAAGIAAFVIGRQHGRIPANVATNDERRAAHAAQNAAIRARNDSKLAASVLVITPAAGGKP